MTELHLYGTVGADFWGEDCFTAKTVVDALAEIPGEVTVRINSGGGIAAEGQTIFNLLRDHSANKGAVKVVVDGMAASAASLIAMAGDTREMRAGSTLMIHDPAQWFCEGRGTEEDHLRLAAALGVTATAYAKVYAAAAGMSDEEARDIMRAETWYDADAAAAAGFVDAAIEEVAAQAAAFDYGIYSRAPKHLLGAPKALPREVPKTAVLAMFAGAPAKPQAKGDAMAYDDDPKMTDGEDDDPQMADAEDDDPQMADAEDDDPQMADAEDDEDAQGTTARAVAIMNVAEALGRPIAEARQHVAAGLSVEAATTKMSTAMSKENPMTTQTTRSPARVTMDARDKFIAGATQALMMKGGLMKREAGNEFASMSLPELARAGIEVSGGRVGSDSRHQMIGRAFTMQGGSHTTSDFAQVLSNVMGKAALVGWDEAEEVFPLFTRKGTLTDFRATKRVGIGVFSSLPRLEEGGSYTEGTVGDRGEDMTLASYGKLLTISRQAIINDDLSLLADVPRRMGRAAKRTVGNLAIGVLTGNAAMSDGVALFAAGHANLAGSGGTPSVATFSAARTAMRTQKDGSSGDDDGAVLNIPTKYLIVPAALESTARQLMASEYDPRDSKGHAMNPVAGAAEVVVDGRLDADSATAWYVTADPNAFDTIEVAYLDGNDVPFVEEQTQWNTDGVQMKVRIDAAAKALDHRTMYKNAGAA